MATTPSGTLTRVRSMPPSNSRCSSTRPRGSGKSASDSRESAMALTRPSSKKSLSSKPDDMPAALPASISTLLPARMSATLPRSEAAIAKSAWLRTFSEARPTAREAACAQSAISRTDSSIEVIIVSNQTHLRCLASGMRIRKIPHEPNSPVGCSCEPGLARSGAAYPTRDSPRLPSGDNSLTCLTCGSDRFRTLKCPVGSSIPQFCARAGAFPLAKAEAATASQN